MWTTLSQSSHVGVTFNEPLSLDQYIDTGRRGNPISSKGFTPRQDPWQIQDRTAEVRQDVWQIELQGVICSQLHRFQRSLQPWQLSRNGLLEPHGTPTYLQV